MPYVPLCPNAGIWLRSRGVKGERRFARLFRQVWRAIPKSYRRTMVFYSLRIFDLTLSLPWRIVLRRGKKPLTDCVLGKVARHRMLIRFDTRLLTEAPARAVRAVIAHELAHCWQYAMAYDGKRWVDGDPPDGKMEEDADLLALLWGFEILDAANWLKAETGEQPFRSWAKYRRFQREPGRRYHVPEE
jgi:hypothetical protein